MRSFVIWRKDTKDLLTCMKEPTGTILTKEAICVGMARDPEEYEARFIPEWLNTYEFRDHMYINANDEILPRREIPIVVSPDTVPADGTTVMSVSGVPAGASITVHQTSATADGSPIELTFDTPGEYAIEVIAPEYLTYKGVLRAT